METATRAVSGFMFSFYFTPHATQHETATDGIDLSSGH